MELMTVEEVSKILGVCVHTVRSYIKEGKLKCYKLTKKNFRISSKHLAEFLNGIENKK